MAVIPSTMFGVLCWLSGNTWPGMGSSDGDYFLIALSMALPIFVLCARPAKTLRLQFAAVLIGGVASLFLLIHGGLWETLVRDLDMGRMNNPRTSLFALGAYLSSITLPISILAISRFPRSI